MVKTDYYIYGDRVLNINDVSEIDPALVFEVDCNSNIYVNDWVYITTLGVAERGIANNIITAEIRGMVIEKVSVTRCKVQTGGKTLLSGLSKGLTHFLSAVNEGQMQNVMPIGNVIIKRTGYAINDSIFIIDISTIGIRRHV